MILIVFQIRIFLTSFYLYERLLHLYVMGTAPFLTKVVECLPKFSVFID